MMPQGTLIYDGDADTVQRVLVPFTVSSIPPAAFPAANQPPKVLALAAHITISGQNLFAESLFELTGGADPYFSNVDPMERNHFYLSRDLRVFQVTPGLDPIPFGLTFNNPASFISSLLTTLNSNTYNHPGGTDPFVTLSEANDLHEASSVVSTKEGHENFNFALARVRLRGGVGNMASAVRVFFRLYETQSNDTDFDPLTTYPSHLDANHLPDRPLPGIDHLTVPMFASGDAATDYPGPNQRDVSVVAGGETWAYYCAWLNVYNNPQVQLIGTHHCLVAQIACDDAPILGSSGVTLSPENCDKLAQRNIDITPSGNPAGPAGHRIPQTFELRPSKRNGEKAGTLLGYPDELMIDWGHVPRGSTATIYWPQAKAIDIIRLAMMLYTKDEWRIVDEHTVECTVKSRISYLPIPFGTGESFASLFTIDLPLGVRNGQEFQVVVRRISTRQPPPVIGIKAGQPPVARKAAANIAAKADVPKRMAKAKTETAGPRPKPSRDGVRQALETPDIEPVEIVVATEMHTTTAAQGGRTKLTRDWRYVVGTFQVKIPVRLEEDLLWEEMNTYAVMKWRFNQMAVTNRWHPVLKRYLGYLAGRVDAFGGDSSSIKGNPCGVPWPGTGHGGGDTVEMTGKVADVLFNCFGEFEGFVLTTCSSSHSFMSCERGIGELVLQACRERMTLSVFVERAGTHKIRKVIVRCC